MPASDPLVYKIYHLNNSFKDVIESLLIDTIYKNYEIDKELTSYVDEYKTTIQPDDLKIDYGEGFVKPDSIYVKIYIESKGLKMISGYGWLYKVYISDNNKIYIFWETSFFHKSIFEYDNLNVRKNKLKKINLSDIFNYELNNI